MKPRVLWLRPEGEKRLHLFLAPRGLDAMWTACRSRYAFLSKSKKVPHGLKCSRCVKWARQNEVF